MRHTVFSVNAIENALDVIALLYFSFHYKEIWFLRQCNLMAPVSNLFFIYISIWYRYNGLFIELR